MKKVAILVIAPILYSAFLVVGFISPASGAPQEKPLTNADVIALVKAGLGDEIVVAKIEQAATEAFDVSTEELVRLKNESVGKAIIEAMVKRVGRRPFSQVRKNRLAAGIDRLRNHRNPPLLRRRR